MKTTKPKLPVSISAWQQDPGSGAQPDGGPMIQINEPKLSAGTLPTKISNPSKAPAAKVYSPGTAEFRYWAAAAALERASTYWGALLPGVQWQVGKVLPVDLYHGEDFNAYYDRVGLRFFQGQVGSRTVYSGESPDIVCHEQGHATLDAIKPQLWDAASIEIGAFHESFGDMSAILCALQVPSLRHDVLAETSYSLYANSSLSRLAEQLGWAIRQGHPTLVEPDCLRNAVNAFFYRDPNTLPSNAPATSLSSEPHSFSRVFTSAFFEGLARMFHTLPAQDEPNLLQVSIDMGKILIAGIRAASVVSTFYSQVAVKMIAAASSLFPGPYSDALKGSFVKHGIISAASSQSITQQVTTSIAAMVEPMTESHDLPKMAISVSEYGLGSESIMVHSAVEPKRFNITGAALDVGPLQPVSEELQAKAFLEDLIRRGKLKNPKQPDPVYTVKSITGSAPPVHYHHTHELVAEGDVMVLKRMRIDCGLKHM
ncbi:hypothetical protein [Mucilaginibacter flavus]|uniref:hypothetical protein n=1 Tax=Mucilaginibacter flavus TaxID=931504 RepID=UPI0025B291EC|nr:hypothetical protein [Mucilaginibacter flavus]MDN3581548.1 hypothetical protein [Mucilaginibacter flavus]